MAKRQFGLQAVFLVVYYSALTSAWLSACFLHEHAVRPGAFCVLSDVMALVACHRIHNSQRGTNDLYLIVLSVHLAAAGVVNQVIAGLQTLSAHEPTNWEWFRTYIGGAVVGNLVWPLFVLLPAVACYLKRRSLNLRTSTKLLGLSLAFGITSAMAAITAVAILFRPEG